MKENKNIKDNIDHLNILRKINNNPEVSQRELAKELGFSLGKINYCLLALKSKGLIKINNFKKSKNKLNYLYIITPKGFVQKTNLIIFLPRIFFIPDTKINLGIHRHSSNNYRKFIIDILESAGKTIKKFVYLDDDFYSFQNSQIPQFFSEEIKFGQRCQEAI